MILRWTHWRAPGQGLDCLLYLLGFCCLDKHARRLQFSNDTYRSPNIVGTASFSNRCYLTDYNSLMLKKSRLLRSLSLSRLCSVEGASVISPPLSPPVAVSCAPRSCFWAGFHTRYIASRPFIACFVTKTYSTNKNNQVRHK